MAPVIRGLWGAVFLGLALAASGVRVAPLPAVQGRPFWVEVEGPVAFVTYLGRRAPVFRGKALVPVPARAPAGSWRLWLADGRHLEVPLVLGRYGFRRLQLVGKSNLLAPTVLKKARARIRRACAWRAAALPGRWRWPLSAPVSAPFGERRDYGRFVSYHAGVDLAAPAGTPVHAVAQGRVSYAGDLGPRGRAVIVDHGRGLCSIYAHLSAIEVKAGEIVDPETELGRVGSTGFSSGPHLHLEFRLLDVPQDPAFFLGAP